MTSGIAGISMNDHIVLLNNSSHMKRTKCLVALLATLSVGLSASAQTPPTLEGQKFHLQSPPHSFGRHIIKAETSE